MNNKIDLLQKLQNENWTPKGEKSEKLHLKKKGHNLEKKKSAKSGEEEGKCPEVLMQLEKV